GIVTTVETVGTPGGILKIPAASTNPAFYDVRGGTLMATNTTGSATGSNYVQLYDGGTLAGNGIVGDGGNNVRNSGTINPGSGNFGDIATLTCNVTGVTFYDGSALHLQSDGTNISKLAITGTGDLDLNYNNTIEIEGAITNNGVCITYTGTRTGEFTNLLPVGYFSVDYGTAGQVKIVSLVPPGAPTAPSNLTATTVSYDKIDLAWTDNSDNEDGFKIERKTTGAWAQIDTVGEGVTTYNDTGLDPETTYYYRVRAYNAAGDSVYTNKASATTDAVPTIPITINAPYGISYSLAPIDIIFSTTTGAYQIYDINKTLVAEGTTTSNPQTINFTPPNYSWYLIVFAGEAKFMGVTPAFANMNTLDWGEMDDTRGNNNEPLQAFCGLMLDRTNTERTFAQAHAIMDLADLYGVTLLTQFTNVGDITTENVTAWVTEMQGKVKYWEIINEPNLFISVDDYVALLQTAYSIIKGIDPAAIVMGPDTCSVDLPWNEAFMEAGGGNYIDAYSIHDYEGNGIDPFHWIWKMNSVRALMDTYGIGTMPIWQTERAIDAVHGLVFLGANQAIHITLHRDLLELFGVTNNHNYHFYTDDHGFHAVPTFVFASSGPHPAALVVRTRCAMTQALDRTFVEKLDFGATGNKMFLGLLYTGADGSTLTLRNLGMDELPVDLDISSGASVDVVDSFGNVETVPIQSGKATITTTQLPIYVKLTTSQSVTAPTIDLGTNIASEATFTYSGGNTSDPALLTDGIMQVWHANNPWGDPWKGDYLGEYFDETPETFDITFPTAREIAGLLVYGARADNPYSAILDYDLQYHDGQDWVTLEEVRAACPTSTIIPTFLCNAVAWLMDNNFYVHQFAEPVTTDKLRLIVRRVTIGYMPDIEASQAAGWNPSGHILQLREIEVYEGLAAPNAPSDLTATAVSDSQINLDWTDNSDNETGFAIERKTGVAGEWGQIDTVGEGVTTYNDTDLDP
ncbi:MAG: fibronectin type III domain-containing protein, partial [Phycisphaerae bacterium]